MQVSPRETVVNAGMDRPHAIAAAMILWHYHDHHDGDASAVIIDHLRRHYLILSHYLI